MDLRSLTRAPAPAAARRLASVLLALLALALLVPLALGPAARPLATALGAGDAHACACGMKPGTCGCPACARLLGQDDTGHPPSPHPAWRSCDDHRQTPWSPALPPALVPAELAVLASPHSPPLSPLDLAPWLPLAGIRPPTPPPRRVSV